MTPDMLDLPPRSTKPRRAGITMVIDSGLPHAYFRDAITSAAPYVDMVKFGWGTALVTPCLELKLGVLRDHGIPFYFGGTLFEKFVTQDRFDTYLEFCRGWGVALVEVSNGTIDLSNTAKADYIRACAEEFSVVSEVGFKNAQRSEMLAPSGWIDCIREDLDAGAALVTTEARESGRSGICRADGSLRLGLIEDILNAVPAEQLLFEAPNKELQVHFICRLGPEVNLGNIFPADVIALESLRLGLRGDTLLQFEEAAREAARA
jgi:phosphosulfolactate synthase